MLRRATVILLASIALIAAPEWGSARHRLSQSSSHRAKGSRAKAKRAKVQAGSPKLVVGAVAKPQGFKIRAPFPCGVSVRVNASYGFHAHKRVHTNATNDYYAVDFTRNEPGNGFDRSVVAVAPGVVRQAGWMRGGWAPYGQVVYIEHAYRDGGHRYQTLYAHLHRVKVSKGQKVRAGQPIGTLGGSSMGGRGRLGFHLHFAMYQDANRAVLGGGRAVLPEPMGNYRNLRAGMEFVSCARPEPVRVAALPDEPIRLPFDDRGLLAVGGLLEPLAD